MTETSTQFILEFLLKVSHLKREAELKKGFLWKGVKNGVDEILKNITKLGKNSDKGKKFF